MTSLYLATVPFISRTGDIPADQLFEGTLDQNLRIDQSLSSGTTGFAGYTENIGELSLINADGLYDALAGSFSMNGQPISIAMGQMDELGLTVQSFAMFENVALLAAEKFTVSRSHVTIQCRDPVLHLLSEPVQEHIYDGSGGTEGGVEISGKRRPYLDGVTFNITPTTVDPINLLYQVNAGTVRAISRVRDGGVDLLFFANFEDVTNLLASASNVPSGYFATCLQDGYFLLGGPPEKQVTADVTGLRLSTATIAQWVATKTSGKTVLDADRVANFSLLTNGYLTATSVAGATYYANFFSNNKQSTSKWVYQVTFDYLPAGGDFVIGMANNLARVGDGAQHWIGFDQNSFGIFRATGVVWFNGAATANTGNTFTAGDVVTFAVDLVARLFWYKVNAGNWNNNGAANPATGAGGFTIPYGVTGNNYAAVSVSNNARLTVNFTPAAAALPSGYSAWGSAGSLTVDTATFDELDADNPATIGYYLDQESSETAADMLAKVLAGIGAFYASSRLGSLQVFRFTAPISSESIESYSTSGGNVLDVDEVALPDQLDPPARRYRAIYARNWTVQTDLFGQATDDTPAFAETLRRDHQVAATSDAEADAILTDFPDAPDPAPLESYFAGVDEAADEVERLYQLYSVSNFKAFRFILKNRLFVHKVGDVVQVTDSRLGLSGGRYLRIVSLVDDCSNRTTEVVGFG